MDSQTGRLELLEALTVAGSGAPTRGNLPMTWGRDGKVLYAHTRVAPFPLSSFEIEAGTGKLRQIGCIDMPAPMAYLSTTLDGRFLLGASYDGALLTVNAVSSDGRVCTPCLQTLQTPPKAHCIVEAPFGGFVYATSVDGEAILSFRLDRTSGRLEQAEPASTPTRDGAGPRHLVFHPTLDRLYCINEHAGSVAVYQVDRVSGVLGELQCERLVRPGFSGNAMASDIHVTPDGSLLYASVRKTNTLVAFRLDPVTGSMSAAGTIEVEPNPRGFAIDPNGRFLLCAGQETNHITVFAIDAASAGLKPLARYPVGTRPAWIEIVPRI